MSVAAVQFLRARVSKGRTGHQFGLWFIPLDTCGGSTSGSVSKAQQNTLYDKHLLMLVNAFQLNWKTATHWPISFSYFLSPICSLARDFHFIQPHMCAPSVIQSGDFSIIQTSGFLSERLSLRRAHLRAFKHQRDPRVLSHLASSRSCARYP